MRVDLLVKFTEILVFDGRNVKTVAALGHMVTLTPQNNYS